MSLKSSLEYKYRPTVKYEVQLFRSGEGSLGELSVVFRTQSAALIEAMTGFFRLWKYVEDKLLAPLLAENLDYALYDGKFVRSIAVPRGRDCTAEDVAEALSEYIKLFDRLMKAYLSGRADSAHGRGRVLRRPRPAQNTHLRTHSHLKEGERL